MDDDAGSARVDVDTESFSGLAVAADGDAVVVGTTRSDDFPGAPSTVRRSPARDSTSSVPNDAIGKRTRPRPSRSTVTAT
jgi:hypothetical protein